MSDAIDQVTERFSEKIEPLVEEFGAPAVGHALRHYPITVRLDKTLLEAFGPGRSRPVAGRVVRIMATKNLKESLKEARRDATRQILAQIAAVIKSRPDLSYKQIAEQFGCGTGLVCQAAQEAGLSRPRGGASPAFRKATK